MPSEDFVHLHNHTEYSMLDGAARLDDLFEYTKQLGMSSLALTDHGFLFGVYEFWSKARQAGIKPVIGVEAYLTPGTHRTDKTRVRWGDGSGDSDVSGGGAYTHMTMWAETTQGMYNMFRMSSLASLEGQLYKPRMDRELLSQYGEGLMATTGCPSGEVQTRLRLGQFDEAVAAAAEFRDIFGPENFFVELMDHGLDIEKRVTGDLLRLAKKLDLPLVATNDVHYTRPEDHAAHAALLCVQSGSTLQDPKRFKFDADTFFVRSPRQMRDLFRDFPESCDNTLTIAQRAQVNFQTVSDGVSYMPKFPVPDGEDEISWFVQEAERGLRRRFPKGIPDEVRKQADYEAGVITQMGFAGYFLVVADFVNWAKSRGIRVGPGRGSGAGSMVAYAMGITDLDPLRHGLIFERFLNPDRVSMPDFDIDFDDRRRPEVIHYVNEKYGDEYVAMIVTYGTIKGKAALKDAARVLGYPYSMGEKLTKAMPPDIMGKGISLGDVFSEDSKRYSEAEPLRKAIAEDPEAKKVFETAQGLEGLKRQWGVHAAGVIMSSAPLMDVIPVMRREQDGQVITQFDYPTAENLGLIKMDFLGLRNLTIIDDAIANVKANRGIDLVLEDLDLDDKQSYELLATGDTLGVFQLDSPPIRSLLRLMKPDNFEDISATLALYRPGPMGVDSHTNYALRKNGKQKIKPIHPELTAALADVLGDTYGLIVYQEQVMSAAQKLADFSLGQADILRRAMGKKKKKELDQQFEAFSAGMRANGYSDGAVKSLWEVLVPFSDYAFNKAHSAAYGLISYWTAYLKAHYPTEYMAALLTAVGDDKDKIAIYLNECRRMGISVLQPDVNESAETFTPVGPDIRFGLAAVRNVGVGIVELIRQARDEKGKFADFRDFLLKVPAAAINKRTLESLIKAGAFDSMGHKRRPLCLSYEDAVAAVLDLKKNEAIGQFDLFAAAGNDKSAASVDIKIPELPEWHKKEKLAYEREMLGLYVSDHPLRGLEQAVKSLSDTPIIAITAPDGGGEGLRAVNDGDVVTVAGVITGWGVRVAKSSGNRYARFTLEDMSGSVGAMMFSRVLEPVEQLLSEDLFITAKGRIQKRDEEVTLNIMEITIPDISNLAINAPLTINITEQQAYGNVIRELAKILEGYPGQSDVFVNLVGKEKTFLMSTAQRYRVRTSSDLLGELQLLLGSSCLENAGRE